MTARVRAAGWAPSGSCPEVPARRTSPSRSARRRSPRGRAGDTRGARYSATRPGRRPARGWREALRRLRMRHQEPCPGARGRSAGTRGPARRVVPPAHLPKGQLVQRVAPVRTLYMHLHLTREPVRSHRHPNGQEEPRRSPSSSRNGGVAETILLITHHSPSEWSNSCVTAAWRCAAYRRHTGRPGCRPCPAAVTTAGL